MTCHQFNTISRADLACVVLETGGRSIIGEAEKFLIRNIRTLSFAKRWMFFYSLGLFDTATRGELASERFAAMECNRLYLTMGFQRIWITSLRDLNLDEASKS